MTVNSIATAVCMYVYRQGSTHHVVAYVAICMCNYTQET